MYRFAISILQNPEDARDAVQEVVLRLWKNRRSLDNAKNIESYCLNAIKNHCFDVLRKQKHKQDFQQNISGDFIEESEVENLDMVEKLKQEIHRLAVRVQIHLMIGYL